MNEKRYDHSSAKKRFPYYCLIKFPVSDHFFNVILSLDLYVIQLISARKARQASLFYAKIRKWPRFNAEMMPELTLNNQYKMREALTALLKAHIRQVILFADQKDLAAIMNEVIQ